MAEDTYNLVAEFESPEILSATVQNSVSVLEIASTSNELAATIRDPQELKLVLSEPAQLNITLGAVQGPPGPPGAGQNKERRYNFVTGTPTTQYLGSAPEDSLESEEVWTVCKLRTSADGTILSREKAENGSWSSRTSLSYTSY